MKRMVFGLSLIVRLGIQRQLQGLGLVVEDRLVIVDNDREIRSMASSPAAVMVMGAHQRIRTR